MDGIIVNREVEKPALSEVERDPAFRFCRCLSCLSFPAGICFLQSPPGQAETFPRSQGCSTFTEAIPAAVAA